MSVAVGNRLVVRDICQDARCGLSLVLFIYIWKGCGGSGQMTRGEANKTQHHLLLIAYLHNTPLQARLHPWLTPSHFY